MAPYVNLRRLPAEGLEFDHRIDLGELRDDSGRGLLAGRVRFRGRAHPGSPGVELTGVVATRVRLECARCLEPFELSVENAVRLLLVRPGEHTAPGEFQISAEDAARFPVEEGRADLGEIAREQVWLALPLKPVCRSGCGGLCPTCGANRNRIKCGCSRAQVDPRLSSLIEIKKQLAARQPPSERSRDGRVSDGES